MHLWFLDLLASPVQRWILAVSYFVSLQYPPWVLLGKLSVFLSVIMQSSRMSLYESGKGKNVLKKKKSSLNLLENLSNLKTL